MTFWLKVMASQKVRPQGPVGENLKNMLRFLKMNAKNNIFYQVLISLYMIISNMIIIKLVFRKIDVVFLPSKVNASFPKL